MKRVGFIILWITFFTNFTSAQEAKPKGIFYWTMSYFGEKVFHPGIQLSLNHSLYLPKEKEKQKNRFDMGASTSAYIHPKNHVGLRLTPTFSYLHLTKMGFEYGLKADAGYMRRFYQGKVFEVDGNGNVNQKYLAGQNAFTYGAYFILAKKWSSNNSKNACIFLELGAFQESNYNEKTLLHPVLTIGMSKYLKSKDCEKY